ncbi:MAG: hypothetical protein IJO52_04865, partial [Clostridia bacterium]|nr:hypothetical protein [Clostridia bacterium]
TDLKGAVEYHRQKGAECTVVLAKREDPSEYGTVILRDDGVISRFIEKPDWSQVFSGKVNTGIYIISPKILELVPENTFFDFAKDLFPKILKNGKMYGYFSDSYWCDIGSVREYYRCNFDAARGLVGGIEKTPLDAGGNIVHPQSRVSPHAHISKCIVQKDAVIEDGVTGEECIICAGTRIEKNTSLGKGAVIGEDCVIGENSSVSSGVRIFSDISFPPSSNITRDSVTSDGAAEIFLEKGICGSLRGSMSPERCFVLGAGCVINEGCTVGVMCRDGDGVMGETVKNSIIGGIVHGGGRALDMGSGNRLVSAFAARSYGTDVMLYVHLSGEDGVCVSPVGGDSLSLCGETGRKIRSAFSGGEAQRGKNFEKPCVISGIKELYTAALVRSGEELSSLSCAVHDTPEGEILGKALKRLGADVILCHEDGCSSHINDGRIYFDIDGEKTELRCEGVCADMEHIRAFLLDNCADDLRCIALPYSAPLALERIAGVHNVKILRYLRSPVGNADIEARRAADGESQLMFRDGCFAAVRVCCIFKNMGYSTAALRSAFSRLPTFFCLMREVDYSGSDRASVMERLVCDPSPASEGARITFENGNALVIPSRSGGFRIISEALSAEAAREISFKAERKIYGKEE